MFTSTFVVFYTRLLVISLLILERNLKSEKIHSFRFLKGKDENIE